MFLQRRNHAHTACQAAPAPDLMRTVPHQAYTLSLPTYDQGLCAWARIYTSTAKSYLQVCLVPEVDACKARLEGTAGRTYSSQQYDPRDQIVYHQAGSDDGGELYAACHHGALCMQHQVFTVQQHYLESSWESMALLALTAQLFKREQGKQASSTAGTSCSTRAWVCYKDKGSKAGSTAKEANRRSKHPDPRMRHPPRPENPSPAQQTTQTRRSPSTHQSMGAWVCFSVDAKGVGFARRGSICMVVVVLSGCLLYIGCLLGLVYYVCDSVAIFLVLCSVPGRCATCVLASVRVTHTHTHPQRVPIHSSETHVHDHGEPGSCMFAAVADVARPAAGRFVIFISRNGQRVT